jgi:3-methylcrotonyl-CoA carboxylase alpha subunit
MGMFSKLLIANRGEIACRIIRTARAMGIATVAVYSDADADAMHVAMADEAYRIGPAPARDSYLRGDLILDVAKRSGAEALHPGYGFLSENAGFAEACAAAGVVFVGPPASSIRAMGGKSEAKALMELAGVPLVPGYHGDAQDMATLVAAAEAISFPVLIKASAGGGGKGMRVVEKAADLVAAIEGAKREAASSFGDDRVLIERYLTQPRHVEIQVFADTHGNCVYLFERDCSVQRRHQKVIEEAPAPGMTEAMRQAMGEAAVAAARAVGYVGAGTVEFIVEGDSFAFMEMNTRLQVEHPVTEAITGQDLVQWQLLVAAGGRLPLLQHELAIDGHSFEARLYAEDPQNGFLPSVGSLVRLHLPEAGVRIDAGVRCGDRIGVDYDPMIAKLITHGPDRQTALRRMAQALAACQVVGVQTNLGLLRGIAEDADFAAGVFDTGFIGRHPALLAPHPPADHASIAAAILTLVVGQTEDSDPWSARDGWQMNLDAAQKLSLRSGEAQWDIEVRPKGDGWHLSWNGVARHVRQVDGGIIVDGARTRLSTMQHDGRIVVIRGGVNHVFSVVDRLAVPAASLQAGGKVVAPIPGRVAGIAVALGEIVTRGQILVVLEAMKMELSLSAPADGVVTGVRCGVGDMVGECHELVVLGPSPAA